MLGNHIRWLESQVIAGGERAEARDRQISDIKRGSGNRRDEILVFGPETGGMGTLDGSANLAQGGVRRRLWPDENERESLVAQPEGEFTIPCESEEKPWPGALDEPGEEAHVVAGDRIRWIEFAPDGGQDAVGAVAATVDAVKPGNTQKKVTASDSPSPPRRDALSAGHLMEIEPGRLRKASRFHPMARDDEAERKTLLKALKARTREIGRERGFLMEIEF